MSGDKIRYRVLNYVFSKMMMYVWQKLMRIMKVSQIVLVWM
jgi:hypothetical protein